MSYALRIAGDAIVDLRQLDASLQEDVLDELDKIADSPTRLRTDSLGEAVHDFDCRPQESAYIVFLRLHVDHLARVLTVLSIYALSGR